MKSTKCVACFILDYKTEKKLEEPDKYVVSFAIKMLDCCNLFYISLFRRWRLFFRRKNYPILFLVVRKFAKMLVITKHELIKPLMELGNCIKILFMVLVYKFGS